MDAVLGASCAAYGDNATAPLAIALARALSVRGPTTLGSLEPVTTDVLWRRVDLETGEGVRAALRGARRCFVVLDGPATAHGVFLAVRREPMSAGVVVVPAGIPFPSGLHDHPRWSRLEVPTCWGKDEPLVVQWSEEIAAGRRVWVSNPGPLQVVASMDAARTAIALSAHHGAHWRLGGEAVNLLDLVQALGEHHRTTAKTRNVPLGLAMRRAGIPAARMGAWLTQPKVETTTPGWNPSPPMGRTGWVI